MEGNETAFGDSTGLLEQLDQQTRDVLLQIVVNFAANVVQNYLEEAAEEILQVFWVALAGDSRLKTLEDWKEELENDFVRLSAGGLDEGCHGHQGCLLEVDAAALAVLALRVRQQCRKNFLEAWRQAIRGLSLHGLARGCKAGESSAALLGDRWRVFEARGQEGQELS